MRKHLFYILTFFSALPLWAQQAFEYPFQNPELGVEERIDNLLSLMTLDEKVSALSTNPAVPRLGVKGTGHVEGLHGLALGGPGGWEGKNREVQVTTTFPQAYGLGETWDRELIQKVAAAEGLETRYAFQKYNHGGLVVRAPNADLARDPRWGRTEESYGEDAFLAGELTVAFVNGLQGNDPNYWQTASLMKHFLANSNEDGRTYTSSDFDERLWREYYALPFKKGILEGGSRAYMAAYNKVNGIPATVHPMLKKITIEEWGQNGIICTDGGAFKLLLSDHKYYEDKYLGAAAVIKAGINQFLDEFTEAVYGAIALGYLTEADIDEVLRGNYRVMLRLGMLDPSEGNPYAKIGSGKDTIDPWTTEAHKQLALEATQKSIVLLKNDPKEGLLPLNKNKIKSIAIIGNRADEVLLDWYSGTPPYRVTPLEGIRNKVGSNVEILTAKNNADGKAAEIARKADVAIVLVGNHPVCDAGWADCPVPSEGKESVDRQSMNLEYEDLIKVVHQANPRTVAVLISSFPYAINWTQENVPAIVHMAQNSQELGNGLADVLFGDYNPAGRLTQTWVKSITDLPPLMDYNIRNGRTYMYFKGDPLYAFGHGLSYTSFSYENLAVDKTILRDGETASVKVKIRNTGKMDGEEVVQLYVKHLNSSVERPVKELKGFKRVLVPAGKTKTVEVLLKAEDLKYWNVATQQFQLENGNIEIEVGGASDKIYQTKKLPVQK
ncbi:glycoside hydrolase family 3 C-terminal domain-containing protein [Salinimicrobium sp. MT39]|uniref:Glycoside hydrolase family 3 C-terminal domain-containing protein n=1 Tax=Salinimicrobium profundisediminis TaxID=2994553 RepID=A0A9X3CZZ1_9FLAO|nr:glycoside hydrolase family 3 C-terminal domain-containing protein [Salinimicrobium profundisediminis]MCX2838485.1 glycoside hydrolase family 3 C-terminal domain-containing protein [Salinimicrobium profundisediminis]